jgi:SAM-dependent methyltransferase
VLDLGCGNGALLRWLAGRWPIDGTGVDLAPGSPPEDAIQVIAGDAHAFAAEPRSYDLVCSVGAVTPLAPLAGLARPGGLVLFGEGYWRRPPDDRYLEALGATRDELADWEATIALGAPLGLDLVRARSSTVDEWDAYEDAWAANGEAFARAHPGEPGVADFLDWVRAGRRRYRELGGRETLGFALLLFRA